MYGVMCAPLQQKTINCIFCQTPFFFFFLAHSAVADVLFTLKMFGNHSAEYLTVLLSCCFTVVFNASVLRLLCNWLSFICQLYQSNSLGLILVVWLCMLLKCRTILFKNVFFFFSLHMAVLVQCVAISFLNIQCSFSCILGQLLFCIAYTARHEWCNWFIAIFFFPVSISVMEHLYIAIIKSCRQPPPSRISAII